MPVPGSPEWFARRDALMEAERDSPEEWWYLSFAEPDHFLGGLFIQARGFVSAMQKSHEMGLNPGGEVASWGPLPAEAIARKIPENMRNRLLTKAEVEGMG